MPASGRAHPQRNRAYDATHRSSFSGTAYVGLTSDRNNILYMSTNGSGVWRFNVTTQTTTLISTGGTNPSGAALTFAFVGGHGDLLQLDHEGNL